MDGRTDGRTDGWMDGTCNAWYVCAVFSRCRCTLEVSLVRTFFELAVAGLVLTVLGILSECNLSPPISIGGHIENPYDWDGSLPSLFLEANSKNLFLWFEIGEIIINFERRGMRLVFRYLGILWMYNENICLEQFFHFFLVLNESLKIVYTIEFSVRLESVNFHRTSLSTNYDNIVPIIDDTPLEGNIVWDCFCLENRWGKVTRRSLGCVSISIDYFIITLSTCSVTLWKTSCN